MKYKTQTNKQNETFKILINTTIVNYTNYISNYIAGR